jgi:hypothetical protein
MPKVAQNCAPITTFCRAWLARNRSTMNDQSSGVFMTPAAAVYTSTKWPKSRNS